ncbi:MAG TPA: radical SAM protein [bacterium]|nr:radical SAM protein [bacterium]
MANLGYMQVTRLCNQKCRFCSNPERESTLDFRQGIEQINSLRDQGYTGVMLTGGEPTLSEHLPAFLKYCDEIGFMHKLITNGQRICDPEYLEMLISNGLKHVCVSFHSCRPGVQNYLTQNPESLQNIIRSFENLSAYDDIAVDILTTINKYNADHLSDNVEFLMEKIPFFFHLTWNNLDPKMNRTVEYPDVIHRLRDIEVELKKAMDYLSEKGKPFQVERLPLCYMAEYAHLSTETRKIVKEEKRLLYFLDERGCLLWNEWEHGKAECCKSCSLETICAGLYEIDKCYSSKELYPLFIDKQKVIDRILGSGLD